MVPLDLGYLTGLEEHCYSFERSEDLEKPLPPDPPGILGSVLGLAVVALILASLLVGAVTILTWAGSVIF
jgi:hypothetical protein